MALTDDLISGFTNPYGAPSNGKWNITKGSFTPDAANGQPGTETIFFTVEKNEPRNKLTAVEQISDTGGRRVAIYEYAYRDGQDTEDLGRKGESWVFNIQFHGSNYQELFNAFERDVINSGKAGLLSHPVRGSVRARFSNFEYVHKFNESSAITIRATWVEDNTAQNAAVQALNIPASPDSVLRTALSALNTCRMVVTQAIQDVSAVLLIPGEIQAASLNQMTSITNQLGILLGQLAVTFSSDASLKSLAAQVGGVTAATGGTTTDGRVLPPVFQVGLSPAEQTASLQIVGDFATANTITPQKAIFNLNQQRAVIRAAIVDVETNYGVLGQTMIDQYRTTSIAMQKAVEISIANAKSTTKIYAVPFNMSLRMVAFLNGLTADRQNDIADLNRDLGSLNFVPKDSVLAVPTS